MKFKSMHHLLFRLAIIGVLWIGQVSVIAQQVSPQFGHAQDDQYEVQQRSRPGARRPRNSGDLRQWLRRADRGSRISLNQRNQTDVKSAFNSVVSQPRASTVAVFADGSKTALGTIVDSDGYILTKASRLSGKLQCELADGRKLDGQVVGIHTGTDLAMLKVRARNLPVIQWSDDRAPAVGSLLASPGLDRNPIAIGVVSVAPRQIVAPSGLLGVLLGQDEKGVVIQQVVPDSGAAKAGLQVDDIVLSVNGQATQNHREAGRLIRRFKSGEQIRLSIVRDDETFDVTAMLGNRELLDPSERRGQFQNALGSPLSKRRAGFPSALQHDSNIGPTNCGGPLVNLDGEAVGINIARAGRVSSLALPADLIKPLVDELKSGRYAHAESPTHRLTRPPEATTVQQGSNKNATTKTTTSPDPR